MSLLVKDPVFSKEDAYILDRRHAYERTLQQGLRMVELTKEHQITNPEDVIILERYLSLHYTTANCVRHLDVFQ